MPVWPKLSLLTLLSGLLAGASFAGFAQASDGGGLFIYLPALPLLLLGLSHGIKPALHASALAVIIIALSIDMSNVVLFIGFVVLPALYFIHRLLMWREKDGAQEWYPVLRILSELSAAACILFMVIAISAAQIEPGGLPAIAAHEINASMTPSDPEIAHITEHLTSDLNFLLFAWTGWICLLILYGLTAFANTVLATRALALRPRMTLLPRGIPAWMLGLLVISGVVAALGQGSDLFKARTVFLLLLLPYFLSGLVLLHAGSRRWRLRPLWLGLFYGVLLLSLWPAAILVAMSIYVQISEILDKKRQIQ